MKDKLAGAFLTITIIMSNHCGDLLGKKKRKFINNSYLSKLIILFVIIFMTVRYESDYPNHLTHIIRTIIIFSLFFMVTKVNINIFILVTSLVILNRILDYHIEYLEDEGDDIKGLQNYTSILTKTIIVIVVISFLYEIYSRKKNNNNFSIYKFITTNS